MLRRRLALIGLVMTLAVFAPARADQGSGAAAAGADNRTPVLELYRTDNGTARYQLDNDWLLGMSLGVSPVDLADQARRWGALDRWRPDFDLYAGSDRPDLRSLGAYRVRWFWIVGSSHDFDGRDGFDFKVDLLTHFSLQTKAGFLVPFGNRWLFGGAITLDRALNGRPASTLAPQDRSNTSAGAYLGFKLAY
jgi:hypothetical protein